MRRTALMAAAALLFAQAVSARVARYEPVRKNLPAYQIVDGDAVIYNGPKMAIRVCTLDEKGRAPFMGSCMGRAFDPFAPEDGSGEPLFLIFLLQIENKTRGRLYFNPGNVWLYGGGGKIFSPLGYTLLYTYLEAMVPAQELMPRLLQCIFETSELLQPGEKVSKLLVFGDNPDTKKLRLDVGPIDFGIDMHTSKQSTAAASFRFVRKKEKPSGR